MTTQGLNRAAARLLAVIDPDAVVTDIYSERGSEVYDAMIRGDDSEIREILRIARRSTGRVLELACGSGRLSLPLARLGRETVALDTSPRMLALLEEKANRAGHPALRPVLGDMSDFRIDGEFGLIVLATTSISLLSAAERRTLYDSVRAHLAPDGVFVVSAHVARPRDDDNEALVVSTGDSEVVFLSDEVDAAAGVRDVGVVHLRREGGVLRAEAFSSRVALIDAGQLEAELRETGFVVRDTHPVRFSEGARRIAMIECSL